ncbi:MAG TPA: hypothetical protein DEA08_14215, partial [Planctomycetes bacterium]|nr:hypothetical protein [Planctomycetota bacterium]
MTASLAQFLYQSPPGSPTPPGCSLGPYEVLGELGRGGMGVVFHARHTLLERDVALKVLKSAGETERARRRFLLEARTGTQIKHPNVVQTLDAGETEGLLYLAQELIEGASLDVWIGRLEWPRALTLVYQAAEGLGAAHALGIVHRDVKPSNILVDLGGKAYVTDFGLVRHLASASSLTRSRAMLGTLAYMAPEQMRGAKEVGPPADVFAMGEVLYECLTGEPPFGETSAVVQRMAALHKAKVVPASEKVPGLPAGVDEVVARALAKEPEQRYANGAELAAALRPYVPEEGVELSASSVAAPARAPLPWGRALGVLAGVLLVAALVGGGYALGQREPPPPSPTPAASLAQASVPAPPASSRSAEILATIGDAEARYRKALELLRADPRDELARRVERDLRPWREVKIEQTPRPGRWDGLSRCFLYLSQRQALFAYGGWDGKRYNPHTWLLEKGVWSRTQGAVSPPRRIAHAAVYLAERDQVLLFGGQRADSEGIVPETWVWDGKEWGIPNPKTLPSARAWHAMAYDSVRGEVVLFGGATENKGERLDDTWVWDGGNWARLEISDRPPARSGHGLLYQAQERRLLLFGGEERKRLDDLWVLQRKVWTRLKPKKPRPRKRAAMGWVATPRGAFLFGG